MILEVSHEEGMIMGTGEDYMGKFTLAGSIDAEGKAEIDKTYIGMDTITYEGKL